MEASSNTSEGRASPRIVGWAVAVDRSTKLFEHVSEGGVEVVGRDRFAAVVERFDERRLAKLCDVGTGEAFGLCNGLVEVQRTTRAQTVEGTMEQLSTGFRRGHADVDDAIEAARACRQRSVQLREVVGRRNDLNASCAFEAIEQFEQLAENRMVGDLARDTTDGIEVLEDEQPVGSLDQVPDGAQPVTLEERSNSRPPR